VTQPPLQGGYSFNPTINPANNHITTSGYTYDAAGNMTNDSYHTYTYDAEGNVTQVDGGSTAQYVYDVFNRRIHVQTPSATTEYTYDYAGRRISSWLSPNNTGVEGRIYWDGQQFGYRSSDGTTYFDHQDTLGTERMRTDFGAGAGSSYASLPWGDGYSATIGLAGADQDNEHFAGMEQDENTSNVPMSEHAQFRQYSFLQGRWLAPDPDMGSYDLSNPQSLNRYAYVLNNPLSFIDPTGLFSLPCSQDNSCDDGSDGIDWDNPTRTTPMPVRAPGIGPQRGPNKVACIEPTFAQQVAIKLVSQVASATGKTVGYGVGGSIGVGFGGFGFNYGGSLQLVASPDGTAGLAMTHTAQQFGAASAGLGGVGGFQLTSSTVQTVMDLQGYSVDAGVVSGEGLGSGADMTLSPGDDLDLGITGTVGVGLGDYGHSGTITFTTVKPFC
jgi:RHS repeat-associated protein